jgi:hypothetical protein
MTGLGVIETPYPDFVVAAPADFRPIETATGDNGNAELLALLTPMSEEQLGATFDELAEIAVTQPENEVAMNGLRQMVIEVRNLGRIEEAMQMAMTIGAMACQHQHMETAATGLAEALGLEGSKPDGVQESHDHDHDDKQHDSKSCKNCKEGKLCSKR